MNSTRSEVVAGMMAARFEKVNAMSVRGVESDNLESTAQRKSPLKIQRCPEENVCGPCSRLSISRAKAQP